LGARGLASLRLGVDRSWTREQSDDSRRENHVELVLLEAVVRRVRIDEKQRARVARDGAGSNTSGRSTLSAPGVKVRRGSGFAPLFLILFFSTTRLSLKGSIRGSKNTLKLPVAASPKLSFSLMLTSLRAPYPSSVPTTTDES
jgi:hypothetical protein